MSCWFCIVSLSVTASASASLVLYRNDLLAAAYSLSNLLTASLGHCPSAPQTVARLPTCHAGLFRDAHSTDRCCLCSARGLDPPSPSTNAISTSSLAFRCKVQPVPATCHRGCRECTGMQRDIENPVSNFTRGLNLLPKTPGGFDCVTL